VSVLIQDPVQGSIRLRSLPSDSHAADLPPGGEEPVRQPDQCLRDLVRRCRGDRSGESRLVLADRLAAMGLQRAAARQVQRALAELEAQGEAAPVRDRLMHWLARWPADLSSRVALAKRLAAARSRGWGTLEQARQAAADRGPLRRCDSLPDPAGRTRTGQCRLPHGTGAPVPQRWLCGRRHPLAR